MNWTEFPLTHPAPFSLILQHCDPLDLLSCRATCRSWRSWFTSSASIWSKLLTRMIEANSCYMREVRRADSGNVGRDSALETVYFLRGYRLRKLLETSSETEGDCLRICMKLTRILNKDRAQPRVSQDTMARVKKLERSIPVMGPPALFIRLKVNHPLVKKIVAEMLCNLLSCIILDKQDATNRDVKMLVFRSMYGQDGAQNFVYVDNLRVLEEEEDSEDSEAGPEGVVLEGEHRLAEALKLSLQPSSGSRGEKRKTESEPGDEEDQAPPAKRVRHSDQDTVIENENGEETDCAQEDVPESKSIYALEEQEDKFIFPTILDLLSFDNDIVRNVLIERCNIDRLVVVPQFEKFLQYLPHFQDSEKTIVGCDSDGKVNSIKPASFTGSDSLLVGSIETPMAYNSPEKFVEFWGGRDKRHQWPEFAAHLAAADASGQAGGQGAGPSYNPMVAATPAPGPSREAGSGNTDPDTPVTVSDMMASLAARGISIQKK